MRERKKKSRDTGALSQLPLCAKGLAIMGLPDKPREGLPGFSTQRTRVKGI